MAHATLQEPIPPAHFCSLLGLVSSSPPWKIPSPHYPTPCHSLSQFPSLTVLHAVDSVAFPLAIRKIERKPQEGGRQPGISSRVLSQLLLLFMILCDHVHMGVQGGQKRVSGLLEVGGCETSDVGARSQTWALWKSSKHS